MDKIKIGSLVYVSCRFGNINTIGIIYKILDKTLPYPYCVKTVKKHNYNPTGLYRIDEIKLLIE